MNATAYGLTLLTLALVLAYFLPGLMRRQAARWDADESNRVLRRALGGSLLVPNGLGFDIVPSQHIPAGTVLVVGDAGAKLGLLEQPDWKPVGFESADLGPWRWSVDRYATVGFMFDRPQAAVIITGV